MDPSINKSVVPYVGRYLRLHGLHLVEQSVSYEIVLRVRIAATRFVTSTLPEQVEELWRHNAAEGVALAQEHIAPRLELLKQTGDVWNRLGLNSNSDQWLAFIEQRQGLAGQVIDALPTTSPIILPSKPLNSLISTSGRFMRSVDNATRLFQAAQSALFVADAALRLWGDWKETQAKHKILEARQLLLEDAVRATEASQHHALQQALDPTYVERYLAAGGDDPAYDILFGDIFSDTEDEKGTN